MKRDLIPVTVVILIFMSITGCSVVRLAENRAGYGVNRTPTGKPEIRRSQLSRQDLQLGISATDGGLSLQLRFLPYYHLEQRQTFTSEAQLTGIDIAVGLAFAGFLGWVAYDNWSGNGTYVVSGDGSFKEGRAFDWKGAAPWQKAVMIGVPADFALSAILHTLPRKITTSWEQKGEEKGTPQWLRNHSYRLELPGYNLGKDYRTISGDETIAIREFLDGIKNPAPFLEAETLPIRAFTEFEGKRYTETLTLADAAGLKPFRDFARAAAREKETKVTNTPPVTSHPETITDTVAKEAPPDPTPPKIALDPTPRVADNFTTDAPVERNDPRLLFADSKLEDTRRKTNNNAVFTLEFVVLDESRIKEVVVKRNDDGTVYPVSKSGKRDYTAQLQLRRGENRFEIRVTDVWDNIEIETLTLTRPKADTTAPRFISLSVGEGIQVQQIPVRGGYLAYSELIVVSNERPIMRGRLIDESGIGSVKVAVNNDLQEELTLRDGTEFEKRLSLDYGQNRIRVTATDIRGNSDETRLTIYQRPDRDGKDFALLFATDRYAGKKDSHGHWQNLTTAIADAAQVEKKLRENYGFRTKIVKNPTGRTLMETLITYQDRFIDESGTAFDYKDGSQLLIYFAGHGYYNKKTAAGYLVVRESEPPSIDPSQFTAIEHSNLRRSIDLIKCNRVLVLMDTCFSGTFDPKYKPHISAQLRSLVEDGTLLEQINMMLKLTARWCLTSASGEYVADTGGTNGHSPFASAFIAALDTNGGPDNLLKLDEIWRKIQASKNADIYNVLEQNPERAGLKAFERPEPRKGQFGAKTELYQESDFLLFPTVTEP